MYDLVAAVDLPETMRFLNAGWWVWHLIAIPTIFLIGLAVGKRGSPAPQPSSGRERVTLPGTPGYPG